MKKYIDKAAVLIEALPYIQRFKNKIVVIKYGGSTMGSDATTTSILKDIVLMECVGMHPIVVHGGGAAISQRLKEKKIKPHFIEGLRVTDEETMKVAEEVLMEVNREIVQEIEDYDGKARGLSGKKDEILFVKKKRVLSNKGEPVDLGYVGEVTDVSTNHILELLNKDIVPVIAPIATSPLQKRHAYG